MSGWQKYIEPWKSNGGSLPWIKVFPTSGKSFRLRRGGERSLNSKVDRLLELHKCYALT